MKAYDQYKNTRLMSDTLCQIIPASSAVGRVSGLASNAVCQLNQA